MAGAREGCPRREPKPEAGPQLTHEASFAPKPEASPQLTHEASFADLVKHVKQVVIMGGAVLEKRGNRTAAAEANFASDPRERPPQHPNPRWVLPLAR